MGILCAGLCIACCFDYHKGKIPNWLLAILLAIGVIKSYGENGIINILLYLGVVIFVSIILYPLFKIGCIGAGDIKLFGVTAGFFPSDKILLFLFFSLLLAAFISIFHFVKNQDFLERFSYFREYITGVLCSGQWSLYMADGSRSRVSICLSGPILCSVIMYMGGIY